MAWHKEYKNGLSKESQLAQLLDQRNNRPDIQGIALDFRLSPKPIFEHIDHKTGEKEVALGISFRIEICNYRPVKTNLMEVRLDSSGFDRPIIFTEIYFPPKFFEVELEAGIGKTIPVSATATVRGVLKHDLYATSIDLSNLGVGVIDGFGGLHMLKMSPAESLWMGNP